jgi:nucleoside-diphosphate-sugar epimerase
MVRVLVTGAQGCIGAWCVKKLVQQGADVYIYDRDPSMPRLSLIAEKDELRQVRSHVGLIEDTSRVKALVRDEGITHILHLAAVLMPYCQANPVSGGLINVVGTLNIFEAARDAGRPVRIAYASSSAVWGPEEMYEDRPLSESDALHPASHYGVFKMANEENARVFYATNGISSIGLRPWTVYGVGRDIGLTSGPTHAMRAVVAGEPYQIGVTGKMDLQYVEDVAATFLACLFTNMPGAFAYNLAGEIIDMEDYIAALTALRPEAAGLITCAGKKVPVAHRLDNSAIRAAFPGLGRTSLREGMEKTLAIFDRLKSEGRLPPAP